MTIYFSTKCAISTYLLLATFGDTFLIPVAFVNIQTKYGEIQGHVSSLNFDGKNYEVRRYLGVPYAQPPVGDLRFRKPVPLKSFSVSPFLAHKQGSVCPQLTAVLAGLTSSEDCLTLNIFSPSNAHGGLAEKAVMVWIHGGGFVMGFSDIYDGEVLSAFADVIVVTINYRLGPLGFYSTSDHTANGNYGLWDQHMAIRWVYDNIIAFGGDNRRITIFGESAGSSSVIYQTLYPGNNGLFKRAIAQSGTIAAWAVDRNGWNARHSQDFAHHAGCDSTSSERVMSCLRNITTERMKNVIESYELTEPFDDVNKSWIPVFDQDFVLADTRNLLDLLSNSNSTANYATFHNIDLMIGATNVDGAVYFNVWINRIRGIFNPFAVVADYNVTAEQFHEIIIPRTAEAVLHKTPTLTALAAIKHEYTDWTHPDDPSSILKNMIDICTDYALNAPIIKTADAHVSSTKSTYVYQFATSPPVHYYPLPLNLFSGDQITTHADELFFLFGFSDAIFKGLGVVVNNISSEQLKVSKAMMTMWSNFAKTGNPSLPNSLQALYPGLIWPSYNHQGQEYLEITPRMSAASAKKRLAARAVEFWNKLLPEINDE